MRPRWCRSTATFITGSTEFPDRAFRRWLLVSLPGLHMIKLRTITSFSHYNILSPALSFPERKRSCLSRLDPLMGTQRQHDKVPSFPSNGASQTFYNKKSCRSKARLSLTHNKVINLSQGRRTA